MTRISFSTIACPDYTVEQIVAAAQRYGYDGVELYALAGQRLTPALLEAHVETIRRAFKADDVPIVCLNSWAHLATTDRAERAAQEAQIARAFELANTLQCPLVKTFGGEIPAGVPLTEVYDSMAESIMRLCERARRFGVRLVLETHDAFSRGAAVAELLRRVDNPAFAALWDVHHTYRMGETIDETAALIGDRVAHAHVKDAVRHGDGWQFVLLGEGELPVPDLITWLVTRGFDGYVSVDWEKMWHPDLAGPEVALPHFAAMLRRDIAAAQEGRKIAPS